MQVLKQSLLLLLINIHSSWTRTCLFKCIWQWYVRSLLLFFMLQILHFAGTVLYTVYHKLLLVFSFVANWELLINLFFVGYVCSFVIIFRTVSLFDSQIWKTKEFKTDFRETNTNYNLLENTWATMAGVESCSFTAPNEYSCKKLSGNSLFCVKTGWAIWRGIADAATAATAAFAATWKYPSCEKPGKGEVSTFKNIGLNMSGFWIENIPGKEWKKGPLICHNPLGVLFTIVWP